jgi:predicted dehydrogenase/threonine dehydrogenase-like Zn-dependent dehydrogenase
MKQVLIHKGSALVADVPAPRVEPGEVLVGVRVSCLSVGTEMSGVRSSAVPLWKKALQQPEKVGEVANKLATQGLRRTWSAVQGKIDEAKPTGYSATGVVLEVGEGITDLAPGDRVACAGAQCAYHAEFIRVPRNLCAPLPDELDWESASTVTLGAIALQGVRRAQPTLGENFVVIGLGLLGQLTVQMLKANGCRTIGVDLDPSRIAQAKALGLDVGLSPGDGDDIQQVARLTDGLGADGVIITAATPSDAVMSTAFRMCRRKGRVVLVGSVGLNLNREDFYAKEIDFFISTSYGPGRYDHRYEEQGLDYPASYVRWTENRNMAEYLRLLAEKRVQVAPLVSARYPVDEAGKAYASLSEPGSKPMVVLLTYGATEARPVRTLRLAANVTSKPGRIRIAVLGAGQFARSTHLPNLQALGERIAIQAVVTRSGHSAAETGKQFGAAIVSTDPEEILSSPDVDAVLIGTRHDLHGGLALQALKAGKHVLVEKPLALEAADLDALEGFFERAQGGKVPVLMTGYNRRFSPYARRMAELLKGRSGPFMLNYRMNAGWIPPEHWVHGAEGGGRNLGEACHIYDLFTFLADAPVADVSAQSIVPKSHHYGRTDNFVATVRFTEGSLASLTYTALGHKDHPKETAELYVDGKIAVLEDYKRLAVVGASGKDVATPAQDKGLQNELVAFADAINSGDWPMPWWQQLQVARLALAVESQLVPAAAPASAT